MIRTGKEEADELTQGDIALMMNHINSYRRRKLNGKVRMKRSVDYGEDSAERLGCQEAAAKDINPHRKTSKSNLKTECHRPLGNKNSKRCEFWA